MKLAALISGGKDSSFAIYKALVNGHDVTNLITIKPKNQDSYMFHSSNIHLTDLISQACEIPLISKTSEGKKEKELDDLKEAIKSVDVDGVIAGAIESEYQTSRIRKICDELDLELYAPLWHKDPESLISEMAKLMDIRIVKVAADGLDVSWLGRKIDESTIKDLKILNKRYGIHITGEGGEYETLVLDAPYYKKKIDLITIANFWFGDNGYMNVINAELKDKED